jgi:hypothetical protein
MALAGNGSFFAFNGITMVSRREVLMQLKRMGTKRQSTLKAYLRDFEKYMVIRYGLIVVKTKKKKPSTLGQRN